MIFISEKPPQQSRRVIPKSFLEQNTHKMMTRFKKIPYGIKHEIDTIGEIQPEFMALVSSTAFTL